MTSKPTAEFAFTSEHEFYWSNREPLPIGEVAETLLALERIAKSSPRVLRELTHLNIQGVEVYVRAIESGSLLEKVFIKLVFKDEESFDAFLDKYGEKLRASGMSRSVLIGAVIAGMVGYGAWLAAKVSNEPGAKTITANNNTIINIGAGEVQMTPEMFRAVLEAAVQDKKSLAKDAVKLFNPARRDNQASIVIDGESALSFSPNVIKATPRVIEFDRQEKVEHLRDVDLQIRATDLDSTSRGWAALIPGKIERRVRLKLDEGVRPSDVADKFSVRADVSVYYRLDKSGKKMVADYILLRDIIKD